MKDRHGIGIWLLLIAIMAYQVGGDMLPEFQFGGVVQAAAIIAFVVGVLYWHFGID